MNKLIKTIVLTGAVAATTLTAIPAANAGDRWRRHHDRDHGRHHSRSLNAGEIAAIGVFGLAAGVVASSIITNSNSPRNGDVLIGPIDGDPAYQPGYQPGYQPDYDDKYYPAPPTPHRNTYALEPWSRAWFDYCSDRYRSFNPRTGTYRGYDGRDHFCTAG